MDVGKFLWGVVLAILFLDLVDGFREEAVPLAGDQVQLDSASCCHSRRSASPSDLVFFRHSEPVGLPTC